jgi:hypothetical protein
MQAQLFTNNRAGFPHPETGQPLTMERITIPLKTFFFSALAHNFLAKLLLSGNIYLQSS